MRKEGEGEEDARCRRSRSIFEKILFEFSNFDGSVNNYFYYFETGPEGPELEG
jgi:hypothetical protein